MKIMGEIPKQKLSRSNISRPRPTLQKFKHTNPYLNFLSQFRALPENKNLMSKEIFQLAGYNWKQLSDQQKFPYVKAANEARQRLFKTKYAKKKATKKRKKTDFWNIESTISRSNTYLSDTNYDSDDFLGMETDDVSQSASSVSVSTKTDSTDETKSGKTRSGLFDSDISMSSVTTF